MKKIFGAVVFSLLWVIQAQAELNEIVISKQYGIGFLPLIVVEENKLIEKHAKATGLGDVKITWATFGGGSTANDALLSGRVQVVSGGVGPFIRLWDKTDGKVKGLFALNEEAVIFASNNPAVKKVSDLTEKDRIGLPSPTVSVQALALQIAVAKELGIKNFDKFDHLTIDLKHPDAFVALTSGTEVTGHIGREPYSTLELQNPKIHQVFSSYDLLGQHTTGVAWTTNQFYKENPKLAKAIVAAEEEAVAWIKANPEAAVQFYLSAYKSDESPELVRTVLKDKVAFDIHPRPNIIKFSDFLYDTGAIRHKATDWKELFFDVAY